MVRYRADPEFGEVLRRCRAAAGITVRDLARAILSSKTHVHDFETGRRVPSPDIVGRLDDVLNAGGQLKAMIRPVDGPCDDAGVQRRTFVGLTIGALAGLPAVSMGPAGRRIDAATVQAAVRRTARLRRLDDYFGGADTYPAYTAELTATTGLLQDASYTHATGRALHAVAAEQAQLAGWAAFDAGWRDEAHRLFDVSLAAARDAGDPGLEGNAYALAGYQTAPGHGARMLTAAREAGRTGTPKVRALLAERAAWAYAVAGRADDAADALDEAETALAEPPTRPDPDWVFWIDSTELQIMAGRCWTVLHRPLRAIAALEAALAGYDDTHGRDKALYLTYLASAYLQAGEVEHACVLLERAMSLSADLASVRPRRHVAEVVGQLTPFGDVQVVRELREQVRSWPVRALPPAPTSGIGAGTPGPR